MNGLSIGGIITTMPPAPRDVVTPAWKDVIGLRVALSTTRPVMRPPTGTSMVRSCAGAVTERISWIIASCLFAISMTCPGVRSESVNVPSGPVVALATPPSAMALTDTLSTPAPPRTTRPLISTPGSSTTSTGF